MHNEILERQERYRELLIEKSQLETEKHALHRRIARLQAENDRLGTDNTKLRAELDVLVRTIGKLNRRIERKERALAMLKAQLLRVGVAPVSSIDSSESESLLGECPREEKHYGYPEQSNYVHQQHLDLSTDAQLLSPIEKFAHGVVGCSTPAQFAQRVVRSPPTAKPYVTPPEGVVAPSIRQARAKRVDTPPVSVFDGGDETPRRQQPIFVKPRYMFKADTTSTTAPCCKQTYQVIERDDNDHYETAKAPSAQRQPQREAPMDYMASAAIYYRTHQWRVPVSRFKKCNVCHRRAVFNNDLSKCECCFIVVHGECASALENTPCVQRPDKHVARGVDLNSLSAMTRGCKPAIPPAILYAVHILERRHLSDTGIYVITANELAVKALRQRLLRQFGLLVSKAPQLRDLAFSADLDAIAIADVVLEVLRETHAPLFVISDREHVERAMSAAKQRAQFDRLDECLSMLPACNRDTLAYLCAHWQQVIRHSTDEKSTLAGIVARASTLVVGYRRTLAKNVPRRREEFDFFRSVLLCLLVDVPHTYWSTMIERSLDEHMTRVTGVLRPTASTAPRDEKRVVPLVSRPAYRTPRRRTTGPENDVSPFPSQSVAIHLTPLIPRLVGVHRRSMR